MIRFAPLRYLMLLLAGALLLSLLACDRRAADSPSPAPDPSPPPAAPQQAGANLPEESELVPEREEIRYIITVIPPNLAKAAARLESLLARLSIPYTGRIHQDRDNHLAIPREHYREFIERLSKHGRLRVERERFNTGEPSDAPVPFVIRFAAEPPETSAADKDI